MRGARWQLTISYREDIDGDVPAIATARALETCRGNVSAYVRGLILADAGRDRNRDRNRDDMEHPQGECQAPRNAP